MYILCTFRVVEMEIFGLMKMIVPNSAVVENEFDEDRD